MAHDYSRKEVLGIIEREAEERNIPRDDFMRFAYIETGGTFNELSSRGPQGAKGLFQFVPGTADDYGIRGHELDAVVNAGAAARLYLDNRSALVNRHASDGRPYLSGKPEPDGLDMYMAHQQGAAGYRSIQSAIAIGEFGREDTRSKILNNVSAQDFESVTGARYSDFRAMSDRDMATTFTQYWDVKFDRVRIPEMGIEPVTETRQSPPVLAEKTAGITLTAAHALSVEYDDVTYKLGAKHPDKGIVDCSGWVATMQNATMAEINAKAGRDVFSTRDKFDLGNDGAAMLVEKAQLRSGVMIEGKAVTRDVLKEGMIIGENNGPTKWDAGRYKGIDHITMVVRDPKSGELMISQSRGGEGVELSSLDSYLERKQANGVKLYATDPLAEARTLLQDKRQDQAQGQAQASHPQAQRAAVSDGVLKHGEKGDDIRHLQDSLNKLGYRDHEGRALKEDGGYGDRTKEALQAYQQAHGLKADGIAGPQTLEALKKSEQTPLLSDPRHPDNAMFQQAVKGMEKLGPQAFKSRQEIENAAGAAVFEAKASGLKQIDHIVLSSNGTGLFAMQGAPSDPAHHRVHLDKAHAVAEPIEKSTVQVQQETQPQAQQDREQQRSMKV